MLLSGDHGRIAKWRWLEAMRQTMAKRPDLMASLELTKAERKMLEKHGIV